MAVRLTVGLLIVSCAVSAQEVSKAKDTDMLLLDVSKANLGTITSGDDKKQFLYTIQLEKARGEFALAVKLDPTNIDAQLGLERVEKLYGGGL